MRRNIEFKADGVTLRGWLYKPGKAKAPFPTVVMAHGFSGVKDMTLDKYAEVFSSAGLAVLVYDNRCLGASGGSPRQDIDPVLQLRD
jgi:dienelactone hydrolase